MMNDGGSNTFVGSGQSGWEPTFLYVANIGSRFGIVISLAMLLPAAIDLRDGDENWRVFVTSAACSGIFYLLLALATAKREARFTPRLGFLLTTTLWVVAAATGCVPLYFSAIDMSLAAAFFESMSGITTTGSTVLTGLDDLPRGLLLWRSMLQWVGGVGFVGLALLMLPSLRIGGVQLFQMESSDRSDKILPRVAQIASGIVIAYVVLTGLCFAAYILVDMSTFDALNHAMTTVSTGGYSTHDASMGYYAYDRRVLVVSTLFMALGALPFILYVKFVIPGRLSYKINPQISLFFAIVLFSSTVLAISLCIVKDANFFDAFIRSSFNLVSVITTTGYASEDYTLWGQVAVAIFLLTTFLGGCAGSTSGGIKMNRLIYLWQYARVSLVHLNTRNAVVKMRYGSSAISIETAQTAVLFFFLYMVSLIVGSTVLMALGLDIVTSITGSLTALSNVGPGFGPTIGPAGNFSTLPNSALWVLSILMLIGRLEIIAVVMLCTRAFWSR